MADEVDSKSIGSDTVRVQVPQPALLGRGESLESNVYFVIFEAFLFYMKIRVKNSTREFLPLLSSYTP